jgi:hypothetical protein
MPRASEWGRDWTALGRRGGQAQASTAGWKETGFGEENPAGWVHTPFNWFPGADDSSEAATIVGISSE